MEYFFIIEFVIYICQYNSLKCKLIKLIIFFFFIFVTTLVFKTARKRSAPCVVALIVTWTPHLCA